MADTISSPNMNMPVPVVSVDPGPQYAEDLNSCLNVVDQHDHTPGYGVQITPDGMNINSDLTFNNTNAYDLRSSRFFSQNSVLVGADDLDCLYVVGDDLYYNDGAGNNVRITQSGAVAGSPGSIANLASPASATYVSASSTFVFQSNANVAATGDWRNVILRNSSANSKGLTLSPPNAMGADYTITFPPLPGQTNLVTITSSGSMGSVTYDTAVSSATTTGANALVNKRSVDGSSSTASLGNMAISASCGSFTTTNSALTDVINLSVTLTTSGNPIDLYLIGDQSASDSVIGGASTSNVVDVRYAFLQGSTVVCQSVIFGAADPTSHNLQFPSSMAKTTLLLGAGTYTFKFQIASLSTGSSSALIYSSKLVAKEVFG